MDDKGNYLLEQYKIFKEETVTMVNRSQTIIIFFVTAIIAGEAYLINLNNLLLLLGFALVFIGWLAFFYIIILDIQVSAHHLKKLEINLNRIIGEDLFQYETKFLSEKRGIDATGKIGNSNYFQLYITTYIIIYLFFFSHLGYLMFRVLNDDVRQTMLTTTIIVVALLFFVGLYLFFIFRKATEFMVGKSNKNPRIPRKLKKVDGDQGPSRFSIIALTTGIAGLSIIPIIFGSLDLINIKKGQVSSKNKGFDITGIVLGSIRLILTLIIIVLVLIWFFTGKLVSWCPFNLPT
jgi:hypothetical protein